MLRDRPCSTLRLSQAAPAAFHGAALPRHFEGSTFGARYFVSLAPAFALGLAALSGRPRGRAASGGIALAAAALAGVSFKLHGKLIAIHARKICVNALRDEAEGDKIVEWLKQEVNDTWERRAEIKPSFESAPKPKVIEILRLLPKTNCREWGQPTCMVYATQVAEGGKGPEDCPPLSGENKAKLETYLAQFNLE